MPGTELTSGLGHWTRLTWVPDFIGFFLTKEGEGAGWQILKEDDFGMPSVL